LLSGHASTCRRSTGSLRERDVKPVFCNALRAMNAFCRWMHEQGHTRELVRLRPQKLEKRLVPTHDDRALRRILSFRPKRFDHWRVHAIACTILDTGCRIDELLTASVVAFDFDNLLLVVTGKAEAAQVPFSSSCGNCCSGSDR
jgi:integrase